MRQKIYTQILLSIIILLVSQSAYGRIVRVNRENIFHNIFNLSEDAETFLAQLRNTIENPAFAGVITAGKVVEVQQIGLPTQHSLDYQWYRISINYTPEGSDEKSEDISLTFIVHYSDYKRAQPTEAAWQIKSDKRGEFYFKLPDNIVDLVANKLSEASSGQYVEARVKNLVIPWIADEAGKENFLKDIGADKLSSLILEHCSLFEGALSTPPIFLLTGFNVVALWLDICDTVFRGFHTEHYRFPILFHELGHVLYHRLSTEQQQTIKDHLKENHFERNAIKFLTETLAELTEDVGDDPRNPFNYPGLAYEQIFGDILASFIARYKVIRYFKLYSQEDTLTKETINQNLKVADINLFISLGILPKSLTPANLGLDLEQTEALPDEYFELLYAHLEELSSP